MPNAKHTQQLAEMHTHEAISARILGSTDHSYRSAINTLLIGGVAALMAYGAGGVLEKLVEM